MKVDTKQKVMIMIKIVHCATLDPIRQMIGRVEGVQGDGGTAIAESPNPHFVSLLGICIIVPSVK